MPVKITVKELAATCQVFYRKIYGFFYSVVIEAVLPGESITKFAKREKL